MGAALLVIDLQNGFVGPYFTDEESAKRIKNKMVLGINEATDLFRKAGKPVIFIQMIYKADKSNWTLRMKDVNSPYCIENTPEIMFFDGLIVEKSDIIITKERYSAFFNTNLDEILRKESINSLVITGMNTHACVRSTVIDAYERNYRVLLPLELVDSYNSALHDQTISYFDNRVVSIISMEELKKRLAKNDFDFRFT